MRRKYGHIWAFYTGVSNSNSQSVLFPSFWVVACKIWHNLTRGWNLGSGFLWRDQISRNEGWSKNQERSMIIWAEIILDWTFKNYDFFPIIWPTPIWMVACKIWQNLICLSGIWVPSFLGDKIQSTGRVSRIWAEMDKRSTFFLIWQKLGVQGPHEFEQSWTKLSGRIDIVPTELCSIVIGFLRIQGR